MIKPLETSTNLTNIVFPADINNEEISFNLNLNYLENQYKNIKDWLKNGSYYEADVSSFLKKIIKSGDVCIDIGANVGFHTGLMAALSGKRGKVIAIEPSKSNCDRISEMKEINNFSNISIFNDALSSHSGDEYIYHSSTKDSGWNYLSKEGTDISESDEDFISEKISTKTLLDFIDVDNPSKVVKIDVEGAEQIILEGCDKKIGNNSVDFWVVECAENCLSRLGSSPNSLRSIFYKYDIDTFVLRGDGHMPIYVPPSISLSGSTIPNLCFTTFGKLEEYYQSMECSNLSKTYVFNRLN